MITSSPQATLHSYETVVAELEGKLASATANSQQAEAQKKAVAHRLLELTGQFEAKLAAAHQSTAAAEEAEAKARLEMQTRDCQMTEQVNQIRDLKAKTTTLGKNLLKLGTAVEERDQKIEDLMLDVKQMQEERDRATVALVDAQHVEQRLAESRREAAALRLEVQSKATEIDLLKAAVESERAPAVEFREIEEGGEVKLVASRERQLERALADAQTEITVLRVVLEEKNESTKKLQGMVKALSTPADAQDAEAQSAQRNLANVLKRSKKDQKALRPTGRRSLGGTPHSPVPERQYAPLHPVAQALERQWGQLKPAPHFSLPPSPTENRPPPVPFSAEKLQNQVNALMERNNLLQIRVTSLNKMKLELQSQLTEQQAELEQQREVAREAVTQAHLWEQKKSLRPHVRVDDEIEISANLTKLAI
jgi:predicted RNase H-like nuclease (RuvC/YqgF family)